MYGLMKMELCCSVVFVQLYFLLVNLIQALPYSRVLVVRSHTFELNLTACLNLWSSMEACVCMCARMCLYVCAHVCVCVVCSMSLCMSVCVHIMLSFFLCIGAWIPVYLCVSKLQ